MKKMVGLYVVLLLAAPLLGAAEWKHCDPTGTWYGGSAEYLYVMTITPKAEDTYTLVAQAVYELGQFGFSVGTDWSGSLVQRGNRRFEVRALAMYVYAPEGSTESVMEMDIIHSFVQIDQSCAELTQTIDAFGGYFPFVPGETVPFVTPPDLDFLPGGEPLVETYARMKEVE